MELTICGITFPTIKAANAYTKAIYKKYKENDTVSDEDTEFLIAALKLKSMRGEDKIKCGVKRIYLKRTEWDTCCFYIERIDGSTTDFSYTKLFNRATKSDESGLNRAIFSECCRNAIQKDIVKMLHKSDESDMNVHHVKEFKDLVDGFIKKYNLDVNEIEYSGFGDNCIYKYFTDETYTILFQKYHDENAELVLLHEDEHKKIHSKNNISKQH